MNIPLLLTILAQPTPVTADPQAKAQAQELLSRGSALYHQGDLAGALEKFEAAYVAFPSPKLMFNIGQAKRDLGRPVEAIEAFQRFLAEAADVSPETMAEARNSVAELRGRLGRIQIDCQTAGAEIAIDGKSVGVTPLLPTIHSWHQTRRFPKAAEGRLPRNSPPCAKAMRRTVFRLALRGARPVCILPRSIRETSDFFLRKASLGLRTAASRSHACGLPSCLERQAALGR